MNVSPTQNRQDRKEKDGIASKQKFGSRIKVRTVPRNEHCLACWLGNCDS
jgi:hypothetical protein